MGPKPGMDWMIVAWGCRSNVAAISGSRALSRSSEGQDARRELGDDPCGDLLSRQHDLLAVSRRDRPGGELAVSAYLPRTQPCGKACLAESTQPVRSGVTGKQHQRSLAG